MVAAAVVIIVVLILKALHLHLGQLCCQGGLALHGFHQLLSGELIPGSCDNGSHLIVFPQHTHGVVQLELGNGIGAGQDNGGGGFNLVVIELTEVLHIHLDLAGIHHRHGVAQGHIVGGDLVHSADDIGQLAHAGRLNDNPVGRILGNHLFQRLAEVAHQGAANAAGVHLGNVDAGILQEAAIDANFAKFVFNQHQLLTLVALGNHLFNQRGLASAQEAGININFGHNNMPLFKIFSKGYYTTVCQPIQEIFRSHFLPNCEFFPALSSFMLRLPCKCFLFKAGQLPPDRHMTFRQ